jgi:hypothetical protein
MGGKIMRIQRISSGCPAVTKTASLPWANIGAAWASTISFTDDFALGLLLFVRDWLRKIAAYATGPSDYPDCDCVADGASLGGYD